ncbi:monooxygenase [Hyaloscypha finlandica]|nr:monooxygenase [Hyaloscypha finlandica]
MASNTSKKVVIVGGSLGGLFTGIVFARLGYNVTILERTPASSLQDQGAGIAFYLMIPPIQEAMKNLGTSGAPIVDFLEQYDRTKTPTLTADGIQANFDGGHEGSYVATPPKMEGDGIANYLSGVRVTDLTEVDELVEVEYERVDGKKVALHADIVIGADGPSSTVRKLLLPEVERTYVGYVTWRGTVKESFLSDEVRNLLGTKSCIAFTKGSQVVCYKIPGLKGSLVPGDLFANLVWYQNHDPAELKRILTDSEGVSHKYSLRIGKIDSKVKEKQGKVAAAILPPQLAEVWQKIESPFVLAVTDSLTTKSVFMNGKVFLVGDAVATLRPHTTAGTSQAAMNALLMKKVFDKEGGMSIEEWEKTSVGWATFAQKLGVQMGNLSQFGDHPMADNGELSSKT